MKVPKLLVPLVVLSFALAIAAVPGLAISKEFNQTYSLQPGGTLDVQNVNGTVEVQGWDRDVVEVHAVKTAKVEITFTPPWDPATMASEDVKATLGIW